MNTEILEKFFNGEASEAEVREVLSWFEARDLDPQKIKTLEELWNQIDESDFVPHDGDRILQEIHQQMSKHTNADTQNKDFASGEYRPNRERLLVFTRAAAIILVVGILGFLGVHTWFGNNGTEEIKYVTEKVPTGEKKTVRLSDGTVVQLNAGSNLTYPGHFSKELREIYLSGEAFFEVQKDARRPFQVHTGSVKTTVMGTSFNIKNYQEDDQIDITLATGALKVEVTDTSADKDPQVIKPGEAVVYYKQDKSLEKTRFDPQAAHGWIRGALVFQDTNMRQTFARIERWYGVTIEIENHEKAAGQEWSYRGIYKGESLENVLQGIGFVKGFTYQIDRDRVKIMF